MVKYPKQHGLPHSIVGCMLMLINKKLSIFLTRLIQGHYPSFHWVKAGDTLDELPVLRRVTHPAMNWQLTLPNDGWDRLYLTPVTPREAGYEEIHFVKKKKC